MSKKTYVEKLTGVRPELIAAATDMHAAIQSVIDDIDGHFSSVELATNETMIGGWRKTLADAIEKL